MSNIVKIHQMRIASSITNLYRILSLSFSLLIFLPATAQQKREFRGAWIHTIWNTDYPNMSPEQMRDHFVNLLDGFKQAGINALIFQVRPSADAFYQSNLEPWSKFMTGTQGKAPDPLWDPLDFLISECHARAIEFHAWFNPYRASTSTNEQFSSRHLYHSRPDIFFKYGKQLFFDPGCPESRDHTVRVVADVVSRYDIDAVHFDDYFYPYPINGIEIPDENTFKKYGKKDGFTQDKKKDWRRNNVTTLVKALSDTIKKIKPWVRFGISPFCKEKTNFNSLYADVTLWQKQKLIDYVVPQLYYDIGHKSADYTELLAWWNANNDNCHLYIGQNIESTVKVKTKTGYTSQLRQKMDQAAQASAVKGNVWWPGYLLINNHDNFLDSIQLYYNQPVLRPQYVNLTSQAPYPILHIRKVKTKQGITLHWMEPADFRTIRAYAIYRFKESETIDLNKSDNLLFITAALHYTLPPVDGLYKYVITAIDRANNESEIGAIIRIRK